MLRSSFARTDLIAARGETWELRMVNNRAIQSMPAVAVTATMSKETEGRKEEQRENVTLSAHKKRAISQTLNARGLLRLLESGDRRQRSRVERICAAPS